MWPFDAPDDWWASTKEGDAPASKDWAHYAARGIIADLGDRHTIKWGFENVDELVRMEIVASLAEIIRTAHRKSTTDNPT